MSYGGDDRGPTTTAVVWSLTALAGIVTGLRLLSRARLSKNFGLDDGLMLLAFIACLAYSIAVSAAIQAGFGKHMRDIPPPQRSLALYRNMIQHAIGVWSFSLPKLSIAALLQRLLDLPTAVRLSFWTLSLIILAGSCALSIIWVNQCSPIARQWDSSIPGQCPNTRVLLDVNYFVVPFSAFLDFLFAIYPPFIIARLHMPRYQRVMISVALSGGIVAGIVATYKTTLLAEISADSSDATWAQVPLVLWRSVEVNCLIIFTSLPTIGPSVRFGRKMITEFRSQNTKTLGSTFKRRTSTSRQTTKLSPWKYFNSRGLTSLPSEQDDIQLGKMTPAPWTNDSKNLPRNESTEILRTVDIETTLEEATPHDHRVADPKLGLPEEDMMQSKHGG